MSPLRTFCRLVTCLTLATLLGLPSVAQASRAPGSFSVISYHDVVDLDATPNLKIYPQTITRNRLIQHFNLMVELGYQPVSFQAILDAKAGRRTLPDKAVLLSFDDGYRSFHDTVYPLLQLYNFPAITAVVTGWLDIPATRRVPYGDDRVPRERFMSWDQLRELHRSPLVEVASHSDDLHYGAIGNPFGNEQPAATTSIWSATGYESEADYLARVGADLKRSSERLQAELGTPPRIMVWPYGGYNRAALTLSSQAGMPHTFNLWSHVNQLAEGTRDMGRFLVDQETTLETLEEMLSDRIWSRTDQRIVHVDLDYIYDPDLAQQNRNLDVLIERISSLHVSTVYLQAFADGNGDGVAEALYFPNRHLSMQADLFNRVAWQLKKRANVAVYAWMPVMAFDLGESGRYVSDSRLAGPNPEAYRRLSPFVPANRQILREIYEDLGRMTKFDGLLFHDDATLNDFEDSSPAAMAWYRQQWGLEGDIADWRENNAELERWSQLKTDFLIDLTHELTEAANHYRHEDNRAFRTSRNIYAPVVLNPESEAWFAQDLEAIAAAYDFTAVMAMPYMEQAKDAEAWLEELAHTALARVPAERLVFELQARDWRYQTPIAGSTLARWMQILRQAGIKHYGYYPDDFLNDHPPESTLRREFSLANHLGDGT
ncbi:poly-beta-1,6-N-acetyl-D-glucosamine N-deacetylase PgaB [Halomonas salinarum]|uniref:poly-beta-1,6-N-acetyl-D-glucosamine N-deacetylase PgaB n=1 Tax=Halomonas salinarum TaxID=1158993 RepID=UPI00143A17D5|nr:poly-beta-1,6-N-acetyl-D-glucosamine N-deacetylase PgaB [Halomonas salinarum]